MVGRSRISWGPESGTAGRTFGISIIRRQDGRICVWGHVDPLSLISWRIGQFCFWNLSAGVIRTLPVTAGRCILRLGLYFVQEEQIWGGILSNREVW